LETIEYRGKVYTRLPSSFYVQQGQHVNRTGNLLEYIRKGKTGIERVCITTSISGWFRIHGVDIDFLGWPYR